MKHLAIGAVMACGWLAMLQSPAKAIVRHVPADFATINAALDASSPGDSVLVAPGVYDQYQTRLLGDGGWYSAVAFLRGGVALISEAGAASTTLRMDAPATGAMVCRAFGEPGTIQVVGFTLTGTVSGLNAVSISFSGRLVMRDCVISNVGTDAAMGRGIGCVKVDVEVYGCRFADIVGLSGSAIYQVSGTLLAEDCEFTNCRSGAVSLEYDSAFFHATGATIRRCRFSNNVDSGTGASGGVGTYAYSDVLIEDCWFEANRSGPGGGALGANGPSVIVQGSTFVRNSAVGHGGALWLASTYARVIGNTFWSNWTETNQSAGGATVYFALGGGLADNVIAGSSGDEAVGVSQGAVVSSCNVFWANAVGNATFPLSGTDLQADPQFCGTDVNNFTVSGLSPCLPGNGSPSCTELIGAWAQGCGAIAVDPWTWGRIKSSFRSGSEEARR